MSAFMIFALALQGATTVNAAELCAAAGMELSETNPAAHTRYSYQTKIFAAAGVNPDQDGPEIIRKKVQQWWAENQGTLVCNQLGSMVRNGSVLRLAIEQNAHEFLNDVVRRWNVDLNYVDPRDGKTVLDWLDDQIGAETNSAVKSVLERDRRLLVDHGGAKSAKDLR